MDHGESSTSCDTLFVWDQKLHSVYVYINVLLDEYAVFIRALLTDRPVKSLCSETASWLSLICRCIFDDAICGWFRMCFTLIEIVNGTYLSWMCLRYIYGRVTGTFWRLFFGQIKTDFNVVMIGRIYSVNNLFLNRKNKNYLINLFTCPVVLFEVGFLSVFWGFAHGN